MTHSIMRITYAQRGIQDEDVMLDFENSGILIAPLQPWNIAAYVPVVMMGTSSAAVSYTHLDVYKRQIQYQIIVKAPWYLLLPTGIFSF